MDAPVMDSTRQPSFTAGPFSALGAEISFRTGAVLSDQRRSETHISSSGGGGRVVYGSGYVDAPTIHSSVSVRQEVWLRDTHDGGVEWSLNTQGVEISLRPDHLITVAMINCKPILVYNHNSGLLSQISNPDGGSGYSRLLLIDLASRLGEILRDLATGRLSEAHLSQAVADAATAVKSQGNSIVNRRITRKRSGVFAFGILAIAVVLIYLGVLR